MRLPRTADELTESDTEREEVSGGEASSGAVVLSVEPADDSEAPLAPPSSFRAMGFGPNESFIEIASSTSVIRSCGLLPGEWYFVVYADSSQGDLVAQGSTSLSVTAGRPRHAVVPVSAVIETGFLEIGLIASSSESGRWTISGKLTSLQGDRDIPTFEYDGEELQGKGILLHAGMYILQLQVFRPGRPTAGAAAIVEVQPGRICTFRFSVDGRSLLEPIPGETNEPDRERSDSRLDPIAIELRSTDEDASMMGLQGVDPDDRRIVCHWYLNGLLLKTGTTCRIPERLLDHASRLDVIAYRQSGDYRTAYRYVGGDTPSRAHA